MSKRGSTNCSNRSYDSSYPHYGGGRGFLETFENSVKTVFLGFIGIVTAVCFLFGIPDFITVFFDAQAWQANARRVALENQLAAEAAAERAAYWLWVYKTGMSLLIVSAGIVVAYLAFLGLRYLTRSTTTLSRDKHGLYPILVIETVPFWQRWFLGEPSQKMLVNPNRGIDDVITIDQPTPRRALPGAGQSSRPVLPNVQRHIPQGLEDHYERAAKLAARTQTVAQLTEAAGGKLSTGAAKLAAGAFDPKAPSLADRERAALIASRRQVLEAQEQRRAEASLAAADARRSSELLQLPAPPVELLTMEQTIAKNAPGYIVLGQNKETGELAVWNVEGDPHLAIVGATRSGKTSSGASTVLVGAVLQKWKITILDPKEGFDFEPFDLWVDRRNVTPETFVGELRMIVRAADARRAKAKETLEATGERVRFKPWLVLIEELGFLRAQAELLGCLEETDAHINTLTSLTGYLNVHILLIDQRPSGWHKIVSTNIPARMVYRTGPNQGKFMGYGDSAKLPVGDFGWSLDGNSYTSWHMLPHVNRLLFDVPAVPLAAGKTPPARKKLKTPTDPAVEQPDM